MVNYDLKDFFIKKYHVALHWLFKIVHLSMLKNSIHIILFLFALVLLSACDDEQRSVKQVLLVYMAGDNSLSYETYQKIEAIREGLEYESDARVLIYHDAKDTIPKFFEIDKMANYKIWKLQDEENSADPVVFNRVITDAKALYPRAKFNLLIFSHASGWLPDGMLSRPKIIAQKGVSERQKTIIEDNRQSMDLSAFADAIPDQAFENIIFEVCLMAGVEVAYALKDKCQMLLVSSAEIVSPGFTEVYKQHINDLVDGSLQQFGRAAFDYFDLEDPYKSGTFSIIKTAGLDSLASFVKNHCDFSKDIDPDAIQRFNRYDAHAYALYSDFEQYHAALLETEAEKVQLQKLVSECVVWEAATDAFLSNYSGFTIFYHSGMTCYIPQENLPILNEAYELTAWRKAISPTPQSSL